MIKADISSRPLVKAVLPFLCGTALGWDFFDKSPLGLVLFLTLVLLLFAILQVRQRGLTGQTGTYLLIFAAGFLFGQIKMSGYRNNLVYLAAEKEQDTQFIAVILDEPRSANDSYYGKAEIEWCRLDDKYYRNIAVVWLKLEGRGDFGYGRKIIGTGKLQPILPPRNPDDYDFRKYSRQEGISGTLNCRQNEWKIAGFGGNIIIRNLIIPIRRSLQNTIDSYIGGDEGEIIKAMVLGIRGGLPDDIKIQLRYSGLWHLLSLSGLHVGILAGILSLAAGMIALPIQYRGAFILAAIWIFTLVAETRTPLIRASMIITLLIAGKYLGRYFDRWNLLALSALIIVLINPAELFSIGFQLSYTAVIFIIAGFESFGEYFRGLTILKRNYWLKYIFYLLGASLLATLGTAPLLACYFGGIPLLSILTSIVCIPLVTVIIGLFPLFYTLAFISTALGQILGNAIWTLLQVFELILHNFGSPDFYLHTPDFKLWYLIPAMFPLLLLVLKRRSFLWVGLLSLNLLAWGSLLNPIGVKCWFLDVGQGNAAFLDIDGGDKILIDAGPSFLDYNAGEKIISSFLRWRGVDTIEYMILTHDDKDHTGGAKYLCDNFQVDSIIVNPGFPTDFGNIPLTIRGAGDWMKIRGGLILFFNPAGPSKDGNDSSLVMKIKYEDGSILFTGDISTRVEHSLCSFGDLLEADVMTASHHGSRHSNSENFIRLVNPEWGVISCGRNNIYGHPAMETLISFSNRGVNIHRTDIMSAAVFKSSKGVSRKINWRD